MIVFADSNNLKESLGILNKKETAVNELDSKLFKYPNYWNIDDIIKEIRI